MENYQMNRSGCRPYNRTCGMMKPSAAASQQMRCETSDYVGSCRNSDDSASVNSSCVSTVPSPKSCPCNRQGFPKADDMYEHLKHLVPAMAYVPYQQFTSAYDLNYALSVGTIFPQLCKPFCGKRGVRR